MGQATIDLGESREPAPADNRVPAGGSAPSGGEPRDLPKGTKLDGNELEALNRADTASADELLAKLAGAEIERLLKHSESDSGVELSDEQGSSGQQDGPGRRVSAGPLENSAKVEEGQSLAGGGEGSASGTGPVEVQADGASAIKAAGGTITETAGAGGGGTGAPASAQAPALAESAALGALMEQAAEEDAAKARPPTHNTAIAGDEAAIKDAQEAVDKNLADAPVERTRAEEREPSKSEQETSKTERSLLESLSDETPAAVEKDNRVGGAESDGRLPIYLRWLEWLNAPLQDEPMRAAAGKVALMTLLNAIAILAYVVFLRPHHS